MSTPQTPDRGPVRLIDPRLVVRPDRRLIRANGRSERFLLVDVVAPTVATGPERRRPPVNLAFVLDRSGSMGGHNKLSLAKQAVLEAVHRLDPEDRFSVVTYDDRVDVVVAGSQATPAARQTAAERLRSIHERNSTDLHARLAQRLRAGGRGHRARGREPRPPAHGRPRQSRRHGPRTSSPGSPTTCAAAA